MQFLQDNFFYHSNSRLGAEGGLENERQLLVEEQKLCRARARKFSVETNRRRKALEERQKLWDKQEQRQRENVLQQRRQRVQDATERFQRAHLPPSQRRRQSIRRNVPNIEDALNQIQSNLTYTQPSSYLSSSSNICRSSTPSPKPPTVSKYAPRQALSAAEAYTKLVEEQSMTCLRNGQQAEKSQEKQQDPSPQDGRLSDCCYSESLSSRDSLENEDPNLSKKSQQCSYSSILLDLEREKPELLKQKDSYPTSDLTPFSMMTLVGENAPQSRKLHELKQQKQEDSEANKMHSSKATWEFTSFEPAPKIESQSAPKNSSLLILSDNMRADQEHFEFNSQQSSLNDNFIINPNDSFKPSCSKEEALVNVRQQMVHDGKQLKHPSATEICLPTKNGNSRDISQESQYESNLPVNNKTANNAKEDRALLQTNKLYHNLATKIESSASFNNLNKILNADPKTEKSVNTVVLQHACLSNIQSDALQCLKCPEEGAQNQPGMPHSVRFIKGILKKQSKYMSGDTTCGYGSGYVFANEVALAIRDSVELTRAKTKESEGNNTVKKKLRWFDQVHRTEEDKKQDVSKQTRYKSSSLSASKNSSQDHQLSLTTVSGAPKVRPSTTPPASVSYHFTKQAWADVGVQVSLPQDRALEVKVPWSSTRTGGPKVPRRERSARAGAGPVSSRARKGTVIRPQSATEVSQIAKAQGRTMVPRPPPRLQSAEKDERPAHIPKTPYGVDPAGVNSKQALKVEQTLCKGSSEGFMLPYTHHVTRTDSTVMYTPLQPPYTCPTSEVNTKAASSSSHQEAQGSCRRRGMVFSERGQRLDCTPTDEEISQLWFSVRSALATKDATNMPRRQSCDSAKGVRKSCMEPGRPPPGSGNRKFPQTSQPTRQTSEPIRSYSTTFSIALPDEGLDSVAQSHLGEVHPNSLLEERAAGAAMETAQTQRAGAVQQRSQQQGINISLEEQKILFSLDRLNHQLSCVREHVGVGLVDSPSTKEVKATTNHKRRASSAHSRTRDQKKY